VLFRHASQLPHEEQCLETLRRSHKTPKISAALQPLSPFSRVPFEHAKPYRIYLEPTTGDQVVDLISKFTSATEFRHRLARVCRNEIKLAPRSAANTVIAGDILAAANTKLAASSFFASSHFVL
jgi:hypothetical protein